MAVYSIQVESKSDGRYWRGTVATEAQWLAEEMGRNNWRERHGNPEGVELAVYTKPLV